MSDARSTMLTLTVQVIVDDKLADAFQDDDWEAVEVVSALVTKKIREGEFGVDSVS